MAISDGTAGAWVATATRNPTVTLPSHSTGQMILVRMGWKSAAPTTDVAACNTAGWAKLGQRYNGGGVSSNGGGGVLVAVFWKVAESASETNPVIEFDDTNAPSPGCYSPVTYSKGAGESWLTPVGDGGDIAAALNFDATMASHIAAAAADMLDGFAVTNDNTTLTVPTITQTGLTLDTVTEYPATALSSATGNDISADGSNRLATAGTSSAAAHVTGTNSVADPGTAWVTRLRVQALTTVNGSFTADAIIKKTVAGSLTADAVIFKTVSASLTADAVVKRLGQPGSFTADALIVVPIWIDSFTRTVGSGLGAPDLGASYEVVAGSPGSVDGSVGELPASTVQEGGRGMTSGVAQVDFLMHAGLFEFALQLGRWVLSVENTGAFVRVEMIGQTGILATFTLTNGNWYTAKGWGGDGFARVVLWEAGTPEPVWEDVDVGTPLTTIVPARILNSVAALDIDNILIRMSEGPSWTKGSFTADAVIRKTQAASFTADAAISILRTGSLTADAVIKATQAASFTADAVLLRAQAASFTADAVLRRTQAASFTADAVVLRAISASLTADAIVKRTQAHTFVADALVRRTASATVTADAVVRATLTAGFTANAVILKTVAASFSADAVLLATRMAGFVADAVVLSPRTQSLTGDAVFFRNRTGVLTADATVRRTQSATYTADAILHATALGGITLDAFILASGAGAGSFTADAVLRAAVAETLTLDATIRVSVAGSFIAEALLRRTSSAPLTADAVLRAVHSNLVLADAVLRATRPETITSDAIVRRTTAQSFTADAFIVGAASLTFTADAILRRAGMAASFTIDAVIGLSDYTPVSSIIDAETISATVAAAHLMSVLGGSE